MTMPSVRTAEKVLNYLRLCLCLQLIAEDAFKVECFNFELTCQLVVRCYNDVSFYVPDNICF